MNDCNKKGHRANIARAYQAELVKALVDLVEAFAYLKSALDEGSSELFILTLQNMARAQALKKSVNQKKIDKFFVLDDDECT